MAEGKTSFVLYADQKELFEQLPNEKAGELIKHIFAYVNDENPTTEDLILKMAFTPIKQQFKRDLEKWENTKAGRSKAGKASAEARANKREQELTNPTIVESVEQTSTNPTVTVNDNVNVTVNVNENTNNIEARSLAFKKSLFPFIEQYGKEMVKEFYEYWSECGDNDKKMKFEKTKSFSKKARLNRWSKNNFSNTNQNTKPKSTGFLNPGEVPDDVLVMRDHANPDHIKIDCDNFMDSWFRQHLVHTPEQCFEKFKKEQPEKFEIYERHNDKTKPGNVFSAEEIRVGLQHCAKLED